MKKYTFISILFLITAILGCFFIFQRLRESFIEKEWVVGVPFENPFSLLEKELHPDTIPALANKEFTGSDLRLEEVLEENEVYTRYFITYRSEGFKISGIMNIPHGDGPFPVIIMNHGYIDPKVYTNGQGLKREQDFFARHGYAVLHSDYRNHAQSDFDPNNEVRPRSGYVEDVLNAINALKEAELESLDTENIGMLGHSMGGGVTINIMVTKPDIVQAYVLLAPIHSDYKVNFDKWVINDWPETAEQFYKEYGRPEENPEFWHDISAKNFFSKISSPVMLHQGTSDGEVPTQWSRELREILQREGKDITYYEYPGEPHIFGNAQPLVMQRTLQFFDELLK